MSTSKSRLPSSPSMGLLAALVCTFSTAGDARAEENAGEEDESQRSDVSISTDDQFRSIERGETIIEPPDEDGRRSMEVRGEFGRGVQFSTRSGGFSLLLRARAQLQAFGVASDESEEVAGFQMRRLRMLFRGHGLGHLVSYYIQLGFSDRGLEADRPVPLRDAFFTLHPHEAFNLSAGQMKVPFDRQRMMSSSKLQLVERSDVVEALNIDRDMGIQLFGDVLGHHLRYHVGLFGGNGRNRANRDLGLLYAARATWFPKGAFNDGVESDLRRERKLRLAFSGAAAFNHKARRIRGSQGAFLEAGNVDFLHLTGEAVAKYAGLSIAAEYVSREAIELHGAAEASFVAAGQPASVRGAFAQVGYMLPQNLEVAGRLGWLQPFGVSADLETTVETTGGLSYYVIDHDFKIQGSYTAEVPESSAVEHRVRVQTQFFF